MARQNHGPLSRAKGKLGGVVYQQYEGMQISREYQPVVKNPQTSKQTTNRAKFKLSSQLVAQFRDVINARLSKLSIYTRVRRGAAINSLYNVIDATSPLAPEVDIATAVNALNAKSMSEIAGPTVVYNSGTNTVDITAASGNLVVADVVGYDNEGHMEYHEVIKYTSDGSVKSSEVLTSAFVSAMAVQLEPTTEDGRASISNIDGEGNTWSNAITRGVNEGDLIVSDITYASKQ